MHAFALDMHSLTFYNCDKGGEVRKNITIRTENENIDQWRRCAQLERRTLNAWISHTLNMEAKILEESIILRHLRTVMFSSSWELATSNGLSFATVEVEANNSFGSENGVVRILDDNGKEMANDKIPFSTFTKRELSQTIKSLLEKGFPGVRILVDLGGNLLGT